LSEHPNPPIGPLTDQPKGSCSSQNTVWTSQSAHRTADRPAKSQLLITKHCLNIPIRPSDRWPTSQKAAAHHKTLSEHPNPPIGPLTDQPKDSCSSQNIVWTSQSAHRTADRPAKATISKAQLDLRRNKLRSCQWIPS
jgi:hypothetical protein